MMCKVYKGLLICFVRGGNLMQASNALDIEATAQVLKLFGDKTRLAIAKILSEQECCVCELVGLFDMSQPAVSQHIRKLKDYGIVKEKRKSQWIFYSLNASSPFYGFIGTILESLPSQRHKLDELEQQGKRFCCE